MSKQLAEVMRHRSELQARIASQRGQIAEVGRRLQTPLAFADQGGGIMRFLCAHPVLLGGMLALIVIRRRGVFGLAKGGWRVWKGYRYLAAFSARLASRF